MPSTNALLFTAAPSADGQSFVGINVVGDPNTSGRAVALEAVLNETRTAINLVGCANAAGGVAQTRIFVNGVIVATSPKQACEYALPITAMTSGFNDLVCEMTGADGQQASAYTRFFKPKDSP